jgi:hypothetical protein
MWAKEAVRQTLYGGDPIIKDKFVEIRGDGLNQLHNSLENSHRKALILIHPSHLRDIRHAIETYRRTKRLPPVSEIFRNYTEQPTLIANFERYAINIALAIVEASKTQQTTIVYTRNNDFIQRNDEEVELALSNLLYDLYDVADLIEKPVYYITTKPSSPFPVTDAWEWSIRNQYSLGTELARQLKTLGLQEAQVGGTFYNSNHGPGCVNRALYDFSLAHIEAQPREGLTYKDLVSQSSAT